MNEFAVIDFETTGRAPGIDRPTEVAISILFDDEVVDSFCELMNPGIPIPYRIQELTGITKAMVKNAPPVGEVMRMAAKFVGKRPLVAHNAVFDGGFWRAELSKLRLSHSNPFLCTLKLARRAYPELGSYSLEVLRDELGLRSSGRAHRAAADVGVTVELLKRIKEDISIEHGIRSVSSELLFQVQSVPKASFAGAIKRFLGK